MYNGGWNFRDGKDNPVKPLYRSTGGDFNIILVDKVDI